MGTDGTDRVSGFAELKFSDVSLDANLNPIGGANRAPVITSNGGGATAAVTINENTLLVSNVQATDPDGNPISYAIVGGADAALFQIGATGALSFRAAPNAEARTDAGADGVYDVVVSASDGHPGRHPGHRRDCGRRERVCRQRAGPTLTPQPTPSRAIAVAGTRVGLTVRSTDADATNNAVTYAITTAGSPFVIDAATGVVSVASGVAISPTAASYTIGVRATSADGSTATQNFTIAVVGADNGAPVIDSNGGGANAAVTVNENTLVVTTVHATDPNGTAVQYSIAGGADAARFQINAAGVLSFRAAPNAEAPTDAGANGVYDVIVRASDGALTDTQTLAVTVADVNEFAVTVPTDTDAAANRVAGGAAAGTAVGVTAKATDADATRNAVTYSIAGFSAASPFKVDAVTGVVSVNNPSAINYTIAKSLAVHRHRHQRRRLDRHPDLQHRGGQAGQPLAPVIDSNGGGATAAVSVVRKHHQRHAGACHRSRRQAGHVFHRRRGRCGTVPDPGQWPALLQARNPMPKHRRTPAPTASTTSSCRPATAPSPTRRPWP